MAHFAKLNSSNEVVDIIVVSDADVQQSETIGINFLKGLFGNDTHWVQTSYNSSLRGRYASIGGFYDPVKDVFVVKQPYPSWILNPETSEWEAPAPKPSADHELIWNESLLRWE